MQIEGHVPEVAASPGGSAKDHAVHQGGSAHASAQRQHHYVALATRCAPQDFSNQRGAGVIVGVEGNIAGGDHFSQKPSFEEVQVSGQAVHTRGGGVNHTLATYADPPQGRRGAFEDGVDKIVQRGRSARRRFAKTFDEVATQVYEGSLDGGGADVNADRNRDIRRSAWPVLAHNRCALYALYAILVGPE